MKYSRWHHQALKNGSRNRTTLKANPKATGEKSARSILECAFRVLSFAALSIKENAPRPRIDASSRITLPTLRASSSVKLKSSKCRRIKPKPSRCIKSMHCCLRGENKGTCQIAESRTSVFVGSRFGEAASPLTSCSLWIPRRKIKDSLVSCCLLSSADVPQKNTVACKLLAVSCR